MADPFAHAPPVKVVDGLTAVAIDIQTVVATIVFDAAAKSATLDAVVDFTMGPVAGNPVFDLRQPITAATLDGVSVPPAQMAHHDFGGGSDAKLRVIERVLAPGSANTLTLHSTLATPDAQNANPIGWDPVSTRLYFDFWFSDLFAGRYLEMWLPSNLIWDTFALDLTVRIDNSAFEHRLLANGARTVLGPNHWQIQYPSHYTALSPMLLIASADRIEARAGNVNLPGTGPVALEIVKLTSNPDDLAAVEASLQGYLTEFAASTGPYAHGNRFTAFIWTNTTRSMEYEGATTSTTGALEHETFHSWYARGVRPATQQDSWLDEGWTEYNTSGPFAVTPLNLGDPPVTLAGRNPYSRITPSNAYTDGKRFFAGLAALLGVATLRGLMAEFYQAHRGGLVTTGDLEAHLIARTGQLVIADYFHRFVYGFTTPAPAARPDLWMRDDPGDPGANSFSATAFWDSPDLWIRNDDDPVTATAHEAPEAGQDNWFYARVRNRGAGIARHFVVTFNVKPWAGTEFVFAGDFLPCVTAAVGFDLAPGASTVLKARWPAAAVPPEETHACWLACVHTPGDPVAGGAHVWEHNNLAQKNLTVVDLVPGDSAIVPLQLGTLARKHAERFEIELVRPPRWRTLAASIVHRDPEVLRRLARSVEEVVVAVPRAEVGARPLLRVLERADVQLHPRATGGQAVRLVLGRDSSVELGTPAATDRVRDEVDLAPPVQEPVVRHGVAALPFAAGATAAIAIALRPRLPVAVGLQVTAPPKAKRGDELDLDVVQRRRDGQIVGGIRVRLRIAEPR